MGHLPALVQLAKMHLYGNGVKQDDSRAFDLCQRATDFAGGKNCVAYLYESGRGINQDYAKAAEWYSKSTEQMNHPVAKLALGKLYEEGKGVKQDYAKAAKLYFEAGQLGDGQALNNLGNLYSNGKGVEKNIVLAYALYHLSAKIGDYRNEDEAKYNETYTRSKLTLEQVEEGRKIVAEWEQRIEANK